MIYFNQPFTKEWALKCEMKTMGARHEPGVDAGQVEVGSKSVAGTHARCHHCQTMQSPKEM